MEPLERAMVLTPMFVPIAIGLLARTAARETARRWLVAWLPLSLSASSAFRWFFALPATSLLARSGSMLCLGITLGLSFWAARSILRGAPVAG